MHMVIEIDDNLYSQIKYLEPKANTMLDKLMRSIQNGTPLPKGHGELVDISPYKGKVICSHLYSGVKKLIEVDSIEPIIEADKAESEN